MKNRIKILIVLTGSFFYQSQIFAQSPNYSGTWVLSNSKSKIQSPPEGMTSSIFIIEQKAKDFNLTIHHILGNQQDTVVIKMVDDGKTRKVLTVLDGKLEQEKDGLHLTLWRENFLDKVTYKLGKDKNEFIADEVLVSDSDKDHNIWVFDRRRSK